MMACLKRFSGNTFIRATWQYPLEIYWTISTFAHFRKWYVLFFFFKLICVEISLLFLAGFSLKRTRVLAKCRLTHYLGKSLPEGQQKAGSQRCLGRDWDSQHLPDHPASVSLQTAGRDVLWITRKEIIEALWRFLAQGKFHAGRHLPLCISKRSSLVLAHY